MTEETRTIVSLRDYVDVRLNAIEKAHELSCAATDKRLAVMNNFREALQDQTAQMATRSELDIAESKLELQLRPLQDFKIALEAKASQQSVNVALLLSLAGLLLAIVNLLKK